MEIRTQRLLLRPIGVQDLQTAFAYASDKENTKFMVFLPDDDISQTREFLERCEQEWKKQQPDYYEFAVVAGDKHIGGVGIYLDRSRNTGELGWILDRKYQGMGYATEAAQAVMKHAMQELAVTHFVAHCDSENKASQNVMSKLGLCCIGCANGRRNKGSSEDRIEMTFELFV